jgi:hypothetical protein
LKKNNNNNNLKTKATEVGDAIENQATHSCQSALNEEIEKLSRSTDT